MHIKSASEQTR